MKLELKILIVVLCIFFLINLTIDEEAIKAQQNNESSDLNEEGIRKIENIEHQDYIVKQIIKSNHSLNDITELGNLSEDVFKDELSEKHKVFVEVMNESLEE